MALRYVTNHLLPSLNEINNETFARVQKYIVENSVEVFDPLNCPSPSLESSFSDKLNDSNNYRDEEDSCSSSTQFELSLSQLSISSTPSNSLNSLNSDDFQESPLPNLLNIPSELKQYMDHFPDVSNLVQNNIDLISAECTDLENYMKSDFGIFSLMKEVLLQPQTDIHQNQNVEMICEMTEILQQKISEMELATGNLNTTDEAFQNILQTLNSSSL